MQNFKGLLRSGFLLFTVAFSSKSLANVGEFDGQKFIEAASLKVVSEIETAKVALQKSSSLEIRSYAENIITDNTVRLNVLRELAAQNHLVMLSDSELHAKAHKYVFERKGQSFDTAYAGMRATERKKMVSLYRQAINSNDVAMKEYAEAALPKLMYQLYMAQKMVEKVDSSESVLVASND